MTEIWLKDILKLSNSRNLLNHILLKVYAVSLIHCPESGDVNLPMASAIYDIVTTGVWTTSGFEKKAFDDMLGKENYIAH